MLDDPITREEAIAYLLAAVPPGMASLSETELDSLRAITATLVHAAAESGTSELARFQSIPERGLLVDPTALTRKYTDRVILVTGGTGCIGSSLLTELAQLRPKRLVSISRGVSPTWSQVDGVDYRHADIRDIGELDNVFNEVRPQIVFHLAAQHNPALAEVEVGRTISTNVLGSANVFDACRRYGAEVIHASTGKALRPFGSDIYAASKKLAEWLLNAATWSGELRASAARFTHVVDNSIIYSRLQGWLKSGTPIRLHDPETFFYLQSAREAAQLLLCVGLDTSLRTPVLGAIRDLGLPCSLLDLAIGSLAGDDGMVPIYLCGNELGYDHSVYPGLYDPHFSGGLTPLLNSLEGAEAHHSRYCGAVDLSAIRATFNPETHSQITALGASAMSGATPRDLRMQLEKCGWAVLKSIFANSPSVLLERQLELAQAPPPALLSNRDREVVNIITVELLERELSREIQPETLLDRGSRTAPMIGRSPWAKTPQRRTQITAPNTTVPHIADLIPEQPHREPAIIAGQLVMSASKDGRQPEVAAAWRRDLAAEYDPIIDVSDEEKVMYFGPQARWYLVLRFIAFLGLLVSLLRFTYNDARISALLAVILPLAAVSVVSLYTSTRRRRMSLTDHRKLVDNWPRRQSTAAPSVDVFLPTAGEPVDVLEQTYKRVAKLVYPGRLCVYVLDDGARSDVAGLAAEYGFTYLTRPDRGRLKKAGNLAFGYSQSDGDVIAVLDADFAPRPDYLLELVPYLEDGSIGIVQSPQYFQTHGLTSWLQRAAGATQELFYRWVQPSRDAINAPICVGTCALYRRSALQAAGGFAQMEHSEDVHTGVKILGAGYFVRYVPIVLSKGICPDSVAAFISQQYRWCAGSMSLMTNPDFRKMRLTFPQRLCFWSGFGYYITTVMTAFAALIPPIFLLWAAPEAIRAQNYLWLVPAMLVYPMIMMVQSGDWRFSVLRVQLVYSYSHAVSIWDTYRGETAEWVATGAAQRTSLSVKVIRLMTVWILLTQAALWLGIGQVLLQGSVPMSALWPLLILAAFSSYIQLPIVITRRPDRKAASREAREKKLVAAAGR